MRPTTLHVGGVLYWVLRTYTPSTGGLVDADSTPSIAVRKNGSAVGDSVTITKRSATTGIYDCSYNPAGEVEGDKFTIEESCVISGTTYTQSWEIVAIAVERGTDNALTTLDAAGVRSAIGLASANLDTQLADLPTVAEFEARTIVAASYATAANQATIAGYIDTEIGTIITNLATVESKIDTIDGIVDAILVDTGTDGVVVAAASKTGYSLASTGLDSIAVTAPSGVATTFPGMVVQLWRRFFKKATKTSTQIKTYADDGTTVVTTQTVSDDGTTETQGAAS